MMTQENEALMIEHGQPPVEVVLDIADTDMVSDELYDLLLDAFVAKAKDMGYDIIETPNLVIGSWTLKATLEEI